MINHYCYQDCYHDCYHDYLMYHDLLLKIWMFHHLSRMHPWCLILMFPPDSPLNIFSRFSKADPSVRFVIAHPQIFHHEPCAWFEEKVRSQRWGCKGRRPGVVLFLLLNHHQIIGGGRLRGAQNSVNLCGSIIGGGGRKIG